MKKGKDEILKEFIDKFCIPTIHGVQLDPEQILESHELKKNQDMVNWLKLTLEKIL